MTRVRRRPYSTRRPLLPDGARPNATTRGLDAVSAGTGQEIISMEAQPRRPGGAGTNDDEDAVRIDRSARDVAAEPIGQAGRELVAQCHHRGGTAGQCTQR